MKIKLLTLLFFIQTFVGLSQTCSEVNTTVSDDYAYNNKTDNFSLPLNKSWSIIIENEKAIIVGLTDDNQKKLSASKGSASVVKSD